MPFPWSRYWRRVGVVFAVALVIGLVAAAALNGGRMSLDLVVVVLVDSMVLAVVLAFPLTRRIYRGPGR